MLNDVIAWTTDGKGGDGKGRLLAGPMNFDDGVCIEDNDTEISKRRRASGGGGLCKAVFRIPEDVKRDHYTVFWVWDFSGKLGPGPRSVGHTEWYTSCADIRINRIKPVSTSNSNFTVNTSNITDTSSITGGSKPSKHVLSFITSAKFRRLVMS